MESRNKFEMCRLCLCENECFVNIFEMNDWQGYIAAEVISDLLQFQVSENDGYTHVVCLTCLTKLTDFKVFKECCQKSKDMYVNMFPSRESLVEVKPEIVECVTINAQPIYYSDNEDDTKSFEQTAPCWTPLGEVGSDLSNKTISTNDDSIFEKSQCTSISVKVEAISSETMEKSEGELILPGDKTTLYQQDVSICKERGRDEEDKVKEEEEERKKFPEKEEERERFECYYCGIILKTKVGLIRHMVLHGFGKSYDCEVCGKGLQSNFLRIKHMRSHTGSRPYKCTECCKCFTENGSLKRHMRTHTGSKPHKCTECSKSFRQSGNLKIHMRTHTGFKPYKCAECSKCFSEIGSLNKHMRTHTGSKPYKCSECSRSFTQTGHLNIHMRSHKL